MMPQFIDSGCKAVVIATRPGAEQNAYIRERLDILGVGQFITGR